MCQNVNLSNVKESMQEVKPASREYTYNKGDRLKLSKWMANLAAKRLGMDMFYRNIEIVETLDESYNWITCKIKLVSDITTSCHACGRILTCDISKSTGVGPVCISKYFGIKRPKAREAEEILKVIQEHLDGLGVLEVKLYKPAVKEIKS